MHAKLILKKFAREAPHVIDHMVRDQLSKPCLLQASCLLVERGPLGTVYAARMVLLCALNMLYDIYLSPPPLQLWLPCLWPT